MRKPITSLNQITPSLLTRIFRANGMLETGEVTTVYYKLYPRTYSLGDLVYLFVTYSSDASVNLPSRFFLKLKHNEGQECYFYNTIAKVIPELPVLRCYDSIYSRETGAYHLLLEDASLTHVTPVPPTDWHRKIDAPFAEQIIDGYAKLHAYYWENQMRWEEIERQIGCTIRMTGEDIRNRTHTTTKEMVDFFDYMGDRLSAEFRSSFEKIAAQLPNLLIERLVNEKHLTLTHYDNNIWNIFLPHAPQKNPIYIIDWEAYRLWFGTEDISGLFGRFQPPELRRAMECDLLRRYHNCLLEYGVQNYDWDDLWYDYRLGIIMRLNDQIWIPDETRVPVANWIFENIVSAFNDNECAELLD